MALARFVVTSRVTVTPDALATAVAGEPSIGGAAGHGSIGISAGYGAFPQSFQAVTAIVLDSAPGSTAT